MIHNKRSKQLNEYAFVMPGETKQIPDKDLVSPLYEPREDSKLLAKYAREYAKGIVLDMGTGLAIQALVAAKKKTVKKVTAADIQDIVIDYCKKNIKNKKITFLKSDLFGNVKEKFDTIIFNPPYLPEDVKLKDLTLDGGKKGYEILGRFINELPDFLKPKGIALIVFSSLTKKDKIDDFLKNNLLEFKLLNKKHIFFEDLYVYLIKKFNILKKLNKKNITNIKYLTKGKRGLLFTGRYKNKKVAIKLKKPESKAINRIKNEINYLRLLNKHNIGPKLLFSDNDFFVYKFIEGTFIIDFIKKNNKKAIKKVLNTIFNQLYTMDKLNINKEEMHRPLKHIIITKNNPVMLDFERCYKTKKPSNVTQFCQFLLSISKVLKEKKINIDRGKLIEAAKSYRKNKNLNIIIKVIK